jgi:hypothetical protein
MENYLLGSSPFKSFWMAGYECADHLNSFGNRVDLFKLTGHCSLLLEDYKNLGALNIRTVREGIRWSQVETSPYCYNWNGVEEMITAAKRYGIQQVWDICHFGFPDDLTPLHPMFARRFASLCAAFVVFFRSKDRASELIVTPINEVGFLSWFGGEVRGTSPYCVGQGWEVKYKLMQAYIEGVEAMKKVDPSVRVMMTEPLINICAAPRASQEEARSAALINEYQFQAADMLSGRMCPELRGKPEYLDILGYNYYYDNQWVANTNELIPWETPDERCVPLSQLLAGAYRRYQRPMVLAETSHSGRGRLPWLEHVFDEVQQCALSGLPLWGVCWYPALNRPDWDFLEKWHCSGIWNDEFAAGSSVRIPDTQLISAILHCQSQLDMAEQHVSNGLLRKVGDQDAFHAGVQA